jgi:DNA-binding MarR family transcriptional regulator
VNINQFIQTYVESVDQLRVLLALQKDPTAEWDAADLGARLYLPSAVASAALARLEAKGLCSSSGEPRHYRYRPETEEISRLMEELALFDRQRPVTLINLVYARPTAVQAFADAFRFRKEKER